MRAGVGRQGFKAGELEQCWRRLRQFGMDAEIKKAGLQSAGTLNREVPRTLGYRLCFTIALFFQKSSVFLSDKSDGSDGSDEEEGEIRGLRR